MERCDSHREVKRVVGKCDSCHEVYQSSGRCEKYYKDALVNGEVC